MMLENPPSVHKAPLLTADQYAQYFDIRRRKSTMWSAQSELFKKVLQNFYDETFNSNVCSLGEGRTLKLASIGCGDGKIDFEWLKILRQKYGDKVVIQFVEPDGEFFQQLQATYGSEIKEQLDVDVHYSNTTAERFFSASGQQFDIILFIHSIHFMQPQINILLKAYKVLAENGVIIIAQQSANGVPKLRYLQAAVQEKPCTYPFLEAEELHRQLQANRIQNDLYIESAYLDVTDFIDGKPDGMKLMSFCLACDLSALDPEILSQLRSEVSNYVVNGNGSGGHKLIPEDAGIIVVKKNGINNADADDDEERTASIDSRN